MASRVSARRAGAALTLAGLGGLAGWVVRHRVSRRELTDALAREAAARKAAEMELLTHRRQLEAAVAGAPLVLFALDADGRFLLSEGAALTRLTLQPGEVVGESVFDLYAEHPEVVAAAKRALSGEHVSGVVELDGLTFDVTYTPTLDEDGQVTSMIGVAHDVTDQISTERRHRTLFEQAPVALWEEDFSEVEAWLDELRRRGVEDLRTYLHEHPDETRAGMRLIRVLDVNEAAARLVGAPSRELLLGRLETATISPGAVDSFIDQAEAVWNSQDRVEREFTGSTMDGRRIDCVLSWTAPRRSDGQLDLGGVIMAIVDVGELRRAREALEELVQAKDRFVAGVSHELRTPITAVVGLASELAEHGEQFSTTEIAEFHRLIAAQSQEVADIVEDLLVAARADLGHVSIRPEQLDLFDAIHLVLKGFSDQPAIEVVGKGPVCAWADPVRTRQVLRNLVSNAIRYGGPSVTVRAVAGPDHALVEVTDDGDPIPEDARERIFQPYESAHEVATQPAAVGLGLTVSRILARAMGGDLSYQRVEACNVFQLTLPLAHSGDPVGFAPTGAR